MKSHTTQLHFIVGCLFTLFYLTLQFLVHLFKFMFHRFRCFIIRRQRVKLLLKYDDLIFEHREMVTKDEMRPKLSVTQTRHAKQPRQAFAGNVSVATDERAAVAQARSADSKCVRALAAVRSSGIAASADDA